MNITWNISEHGVHAMLGNVNGQHAGIGFWKIQTIHGGWMQERKRRGMYGGRWMTGRLTWNCIDALTKCLFMCICESRERLFLTYNWLFTIASENGVVWDERCARSASRPLKTCARCLIDFSCYFLDVYYLVQVFPTIMLYVRNDTSAHISMMLVSIRIEQVDKMEPSLVREIQMFAWFRI